jgi:hypothetical protein
MFSVKKAYALAISHELNKEEVLNGRETRTKRLESIFGRRPYWTAIGSIGLVYR